MTSLTTADDVPEYPEVMSFSFTPGVKKTNGGATSGESDLEKFTKALAKTKHTSQQSLKKLTKVTERLEEVDKELELLTNEMKNLKNEMEVVKNNTEELKEDINKLKDKNEYMRISHKYQRMKLKTFESSKKTIYLWSTDRKILFL